MLSVDPDDEDGIATAQYWNTCFGVDNERFYKNRKDIASFAEMNAVWDAWVPAGHTPARACVEAKLAGPQYLVEIAIIAAV
jgi:enamine deaminase RidA (YjgF/YER057c/UK114 family)